MNHPEFQQNCLSGEATMAAATTTSTIPTSSSPPDQKLKRRRQDIADDEDVEVIALSADELTAQNQFTCDLCNKCFSRVQNLQLHKRGHKLPCVLRNPNKPTTDDYEKRKVYVCPETSCISHNRRNALCDLTSIKKHYRRKHSEKTLNCSNCQKKYAVYGDLKAHSKICGSKEYKCDCGCIFSRRDSYVNHRTLCDAMLAWQSKSLDNCYSITGPSTETLIGPTMLDCFAPQLANTPTTMTGASSFTFLDGEVLAPPPPPPPHNFSLESSPILLSYQPDHYHVTATDPASIISNTQVMSQNINDSNDNNFDINVLYDKLFSAAPIAPSAGTLEVQQGSTLDNFGGSVTYLENSIVGGSVAANFDAYPNFSSSTVGSTCFPVLESSSGCSLYDSGDQLSGICGNNKIGGNVDFNLEDNTGGAEEYDGGLQLSNDNRALGNNASLPVLQNDISLWENWG